MFAIGEICHGTPASRVGTAGLVAPWSDAYLQRMAIVVYYDFISVESFALSELLAERGLHDGIDWRGVESQRGIAAAGLDLDRRVQGRFEMELAPLVRSQPGLQVRIPKRLPNPVRAMQAVAAVARVHPRRAEEFRIRLFRELWQLGGDIADRMVIRQLAGDVGVPPFADLEHIEAQTAQTRWQVDWETARLGGVPRAIRPDGEILWRVDAIPDVLRFFGSGTSRTA
ncbi:MAG: hypothetical protein FJ202_10880 [Gemmatimonadetes bacterium]|nr:hypothetical protein [Gemmatimonadota bacterium]